MQDDHHGVKKGDRPVREMVDEALHNLIHFDINAFRVVPELLFRPGRLAETTLEGKKIYVRPFALFVFVNFTFFLLKAEGLFHYTLDAYAVQFADRIAAASSEMNLSMELLRERFNTAMHFEKKGYLVMLVPLFAVLMQVAFITKRRHFVEFVVLSLYFYSAFIIFMIALPYMALPLTWIPGTDSFVRSEGFVTGAFTVFPFVWLYAMLRYLFKERRLVIMVKAAVLSYCSLLLIVFVYRTVLFFVTMHAIR